MMHHFDRLNIVAPEEYLFGVGKFGWCNIF